VVGERRSAINPAQVDAIFASLDAVRFDNWFVGPRSKARPQNVEADGTIHVVLESKIDAPETRLTVRRRGISRAVTYVYPPPALVPVEMQMLNLGDVREWLARPKR